MRELLPIIPRPSHYTGTEPGTCHKDPQSVRLRLALAFPDTYEIGMSYLGQKILYDIVNSNEHWWAERVMAPERETGEILRKHEMPLATLESDTPLSDLHCVAFSITHELCYTNVLYMLDLAGIALRTEQRSQDLRECPLVIAGGGALLAAEPLAPFMDLMVLGDGEEVFPELLRLVEQAVADGWQRRQVLLEASRMPGIYVPSFFELQKDGTAKPLHGHHARPARRIVADMDLAPYPSRQVVPVDAIHNRLSLEIARGCTRGCRFCQAGMVYRPVRERSLPKIQELVNDCLAKTGFDEISFLSLSTGDFSALKHLCHAVLDRLAHEQVSLSLPSLRVGSIDDDIIRRMGDLRRTGCTLAPEAGSQRLRDVINKGISEEDVILHIQKIIEHGWRQVKLYFMIGLPTETDDDLAAIVELCRKVRDAAGRGGPRLQVTAALSPFVPKPFTPFQWDEQISQQEILRRVNVVRGLAKSQKGLTVRWHEPAMSHLEGILSRADRSMADVVEKAYRKGAIFSSWAEGFELAPWLEALAECGISAADCIAARRMDMPLPWSHLEAGISNEFLLRERQRAEEGKTTSDCRYTACHLCGACDRKGQISLMPHAPGNGDQPATHENRLNFPQRDQCAHAPTFDEEGRLVCRVRENKPPQLAGHLSFKALRYRVWHTKHGSSSYLSQLELQAALERALRKAQIPLAFSQGFHPLPLLSFGRALPVGVSSNCEWFNVTLREPLAQHEFMQRLAPHLPSGMCIQRLEVIGIHAPVIQASSEGFDLYLPQDYPIDDVLGCFESFAAKKEFPFSKQGKKGIRQMDLRPLLSNWHPTTGQEQTLYPDFTHVLSFVTNWQESYVSPVLFCLSILQPLDEDDNLKAHLRLLKTAQNFPGK